MQPRINKFLRVALLLTVPVLLTLGFKHASALKLLRLSKVEQAKVHKARLSYSTLQNRLDWLGKEIPQRIPDVLKHIEKNKTKISLLVYKKEKVMELWVREPELKKLKTYKMFGFSGHMGPKNRQGDRQIPEGIYRASVLNPNSSYYLSIGINYPNANDRKRGSKNKVRDLGGDIYIHGRNATIGCVPIGDHYIEEVFYIVGQVGLLNTRVVISPSRLPLPTLEALKLDPKDDLLKEKYSKITAELTQYL